MAQEEDFSIPLAVFLSKGKQGEFPVERGLNGKRNKRVGEWCEEKEEEKWRGKCFR